MKRELLIDLTYKAQHHVARLNHPAHSHPHYHTWRVRLRFIANTDAHPIQVWMHEAAPHFGDHGDMGVEDIADWWIEQAHEKFSGQDSGVEVSGVEVFRDDGIGVSVSRS